jgi:hypothetical protein
MKLRSTALFDATSVNTLIHPIKMFFYSVARFLRNLLAASLPRHSPYLVLIIECLWANVSVGSEGGLYSLHLVVSQARSHTGYGIPDFGNRSAVKFVETLNWNPSLRDSDKYAKFILGVESALPLGEPNSDTTSNGSSENSQSNIGKEAAHFGLRVVGFFVGLGLVMWQADRVERLIDWVENLPWRWRTRFSSNK